MADIKVNAKGIGQLPSNLNLHKAAGPDQIKPIIHKNLSSALFPFSRSGRMPKGHLSTKMVTDQNQQAIDQYP